ncbi:MAG TPA: RDD family protein [Mycobacterium sp.]|nr:RDD family protein [Mycobacterium sp.]
MTSGNYPPPDPNIPPPPSGYPPPPPPGYAPPPPPPGYAAPQYGAPQYGPPAGYPPPGAQFGGQPGTLGVRFGARVIDGIIVGVISFLLAMIFGSESNILVTGLFSGVLMFAYFVAMEVTQGWTFGKKLLGLSVRGANGTPKPDLKESAIRNSFTLLPIVPYIGGLLAFIAYVVIAVTINGSPTKQGKHDQLAGGTQVVKN